MKVYLIGSLRNPRIPVIARQLQVEGFDVFADWFGAGERADDSWQEFETSMGRSYGDALYGPAAVNIFEFDRHHIETSEVVVLIAPAGKSGHLELGWALGKGKRGYVLFEEEPARWDVMYQFATDVFFSVEDLIDELDVPQARRAWAS